MRHYNYLQRLSLAAVVLFISLVSFSQTDTIKHHSLDSMIRRQKGIIGQLAKNLLTDTFEIDPGLLRNDKPFQRYTDRVIRQDKDTSASFRCAYRRYDQKNRKNFERNKKAGQ